MTGKGQRGNGNNDAPLPALTREGSVRDGL